MKKNTKSSSATRKSRHSKSTAKKPVTIDLQAEKVASTSETETTAKSAAASSAKKSTPKVKSNTSGFGRAAETKTESGKEKPTNPENLQTTTPKTNAPMSKPAEKSGSGLFGKFAAAIVGGLIALGGASALQFGGYLPAPNATTGTDYASSTALTETRSDLLSKVEALQNRIKQAETDLASDPDKMNAVIDARVQQLQDGSASTQVGKADIEGLDNKITASGEVIAALQQQVATAEVEVNKMRQALSNGQAGEEAGLATLGSRLDTVDTTLSDMSSKLTAVEDRASKPSAPDATTLSALTALQAVVPKLQSNVDARLSDVSNQITAAKEETKTLVSPLEDKIGALSAQIDNLSASTNSTKEIVATLQNTVEASIQTEKRAARAIAAAAVKSAIDRGEPYKEALATLKNVTGENEEFSSLATFAESGVPTQTQLTAQFANVGENIVTALTPKTEGNLTDRLLAGAKKLVKVKSIGVETADTPRDKVSKIANQLADSNMTAASELWSALPEAGKAASQQWHDSLQARIKANALVDQTIQTYLLSGSGQ